MLCFDGTRDGDLYLQLASGRFIAAHGFVAVDPFRTIAHGQPWLNQQWLDELLAVLAVGAAATWAIALGPARDEPLLDQRLIGYALRHPPPSGHIATYAGIGSYMLWRAPRAPVELDGWLEHFSAAELSGTYAVLDGRAADPTPYVRRLRIGAVIADRHVAIRALRAHGFAVEFHDPGGTYLVRTRQADRPGSG